jgi:hypothetical protein
MVFYSLGSLTFAPMLSLTVLFDHSVARGMGDPWKKNNKRLPILLFPILGG